MMNKAPRQKRLWQFVSLMIVSFFLSFLLTNCSQKKNDNEIRFATNATYPPFEYVKEGKIVGFDIDLANMIAAELGKKAVIEDMQFQNILPSVDKGQVDAAIATMTLTEERKKNFDFSDPYYYANLAMVFSKSKPINNIAEITNKKAACQIGTTMEIWLKNSPYKPQITTFDDNNQAVESLKAGHADFVMIDNSQAKSFTKNNPTLTYVTIADSGDGYGIALKKNSPLTTEINQAIKNLKDRGEIEQLEKKWINGGDNQ